MYDKFINIGKLVQNSYGRIISNTGKFSCLENRDSRCLFPQVGKSVLR
jgi:hypothetical protein